MPFAKWRRGPQGQYHYHALVLTPEGRLEDPSLVLGMGKERAFSEAGTAEKMKAGTVPVVIKYAKHPDVTVVDPEAPSGYAGGKSKELDEVVLRKLQGGGRLVEPADAALRRRARAARLRGQPGGWATCSEEGVADLDAALGWSREHKQFVPYDAEAELRRLRAYGSR